MTDNELFVFIKDVMTTGVRSFGALTNVEVRQSFQPLQQGANAAPTLYVFKQFDKRIGSPRRRDVWNPQTGGFEQSLVQQLESTYQITATADVDPSNPAPIFPADLANLASAIMSADSTILSLRELGAGILRITDVRNPITKDDRNEFASSPNFDFVITHKRIVDSTTPAVTRITDGFHRV